MTRYMPPVEDVKRYSQEHSVKLFDAVKILRKEHNKHHTPTDEFRFAFKTCRRNHSAVYQRYCSVCGANYCTECQDAAAIRARNGAQT